MTLNLKTNLYLISTDSSGIGCQIKSLLTTEEALVFI